MAAGRAWAGWRPSRTDPERIEAEAAFFGLTLPPPEEEPAVEVWTEVEAAVRAFLAVSGQWRAAAGGMGGVIWVGLDYTAARAGLDLAGITVTPEDWARVRLIEAGARAELNRGS